MTNTHDCVCKNMGAHKIWSPFKSMIVNNFVYFWYDYTVFYSCCRTFIWLFCCYVTRHLKMRTCTVASSFRLDELLVKLPFMASIQCFSSGNEVGSPQNPDEMESVVTGTQ